LLCFLRELWNEFQSQRRAVVMSGSSPEALQSAPPRPVPAFLEKLLKANSRVICTAKGADVRKVSVMELLSERLRVPIFQRRYCWGPENWDTLLDDALCVVRGAKEKHSLGRITCVREKPDSRGQGRLVVVDGQQRNTTCTLLLAAIRDVASLRMDGRSRDADADTLRRLVRHINDVLFPDQHALEAWQAQHSNGVATAVAEGEAIQCAALVPTFHDRAAYFASIAPHCAQAADMNAAVSVDTWQRPAEAKVHFAARVEPLSDAELTSLADVVLHCLEWLFFPIDVTHTFHDGTEDLHLIYERLAQRDATFCKPSRGSEFVTMGAWDFVRNLVLGSFRHEEDAIAMYHQHWLPIEEAAMRALTRHRRSASMAALLESVLDSFLKTQLAARPTAAAPAPCLPRAVVGGDLYSRFRLWFVAAIAADDSAELGSGCTEAMERRTVALLQRLQLFAVQQLDEDLEPGESRPSSSSSARPNSCAVPSRWRCSRCTFVNKVDQKHCTACLRARPAGEQIAAGSSGCVRATRAGLGRLPAHEESN